MSGPILGSDAEALAARVPNGASVALFKDQAPVALARALVRRAVQGLHVITVPTGGLAVDLLIGAGCVDVVETSGVTLGEHGAAPAFGRAVKDGRVRPLDATCPAIYAALQAGAKGTPFTPIRGILGTDVLVHRSDWKVIDNPFQKDDPIVVLPALRPDFGLLHAVRADSQGNVWVGEEEGLRIIAQAAHRVLVTVEEVVDADLMADSVTAAGTIPAFYVEAVAPVPGGCRPLGLRGCYDEDPGAIRRYIERARAGAPVGAWLEPVADAA